MYPQEIMVGAVLPESNFMLTAQSLTQAAATYGVFTAHYPFVVQRVTFKVSTAVNNLTNSVVVANLVSNITNATPTTTAICTLTIKNGATAGSVYYNNCSPVIVPVSAQLQFALKTQGGLGGTPAGAGFCGFYATLQPEDYTNNTNAVGVTA